MRAPERARRPRDPRIYQIAVLAAIAVYGLVALDLELTVARAALFIGACLLTQLVAGHLVGLPRFDPKSPLISGLSLCLLLRTDSWLPAAVAAVATIGSKFLLRWNGRHVFNPSNFGIVVVVLLFDSAWISPGQWGSAALAAFALACAGGWVVFRAARSVVTAAFLAAYGAILAGRALWLGDPLTIPLHQLASGGLLIFAFFMISDPKTTPSTRAGQIAFSVLIAVGAVWIRFGLHDPNGLLLALPVATLAVPLIDRALPGARYEWPGTAATPARPPIATPATATLVPETAHRSSP